MRALAPELLEYCGVATHIHSNFPHNPTCSGTQTLDEIVDLAEELGFSGVALTEHTSDPASPHRVTSDDLIDAITRNSGDVHHLGQRLRAIGSDFRLWSGVEANIMPDGTLDIPAGKLAGLVRYIVASQHGGLGDDEKDPDLIVDRLKATCWNLDVDAIGHPTRYNDDVLVDWPTILDSARRTNTMVELNLNLWFSKGPGRGPEAINNQAWYEQQLVFWRNWLREVAASGAPVVIGLDAHNAGMWPQENPTESWMTTVDHFTQFILLIRSAGIKPDQVINSTTTRFADWLARPKADRVSLVTW